MRHVLVVFCVVVFGVLFTLSALGSFRLKADAPRPVLTVWHQRVSPPVPLRCDECPQPGDVLRMRLRGSPNTVHGIAVYRDERPFDFCFGCVDFSTVIDCVGRYSVIGFQMRQGSALAQCGIALAEKAVDVR